MTGELIPITGEAADSAPASRRAGPWARVALACLVLPALTGPAAARPAVSDPPAAAATAPAGQPIPAVETRANLDGFYLLGGPVAETRLSEASWLPAYGLVVGLVRLRERQWPSVLGLTAGAVRHEGEPAGRVWFGAVAGSALAGIEFGLEVAGGFELAEDQHPRAGGSLALWAFAGVSPFLKAGWNQERGGVLEVGVALPLPLRRW